MKESFIKNIPKDAVYKDVVIVGNGPSGISLSYMLAGNWPYWNIDKIKKHPDELLQARLAYAENNCSLIEHDLQTLADGLEGRSTNPVSLLYDSLEHPGADIGLEIPTMLEYKQHPNGMIDHIVLGKGPPGGAWHRMDPDLRTLSLASWMSLPGLSYNDWEERQFKIATAITSNMNEKKGSDKNISISKSAETAENGLRKQVLRNGVCQKCIESRRKIALSSTKGHENNNESESGALCCKCTKTSTNANNAHNQEITETVALKNPSRKKSIDEMSFAINRKSSKNENTKTPRRRNLSLKRQVSKEVQTRALVSRVAQYYEQYVRIMELEKFFMNDFNVTMIIPIHASYTCSQFKDARWLVCGINRVSGKISIFACHNVVLANGASDLANRLGLQSENHNFSWVKHELPQLESALEAFNEEERKRLKPVCVCGAGLSAADAITICRSSGIQVIHVYRSRYAGLDRMLPENIYPEYHEVHKMMKDSFNVYEHYLPLPESAIIDITNGPGGAHKVTVQNLKTHETATFDVSFSAILIGSRPDLRFVASLSKWPLKSTAASVDIGTKCHTETVHQIPTNGRKFTWLKNICAKCKNLNICEWSRRSIEYRRVFCQFHGTGCAYGKISSYERNNCQLEENRGTGLGLGIEPSKPIDCKKNQIAVAKYTNEVLRAPKGLYAMGPLVGDNFVRFIAGGALAIAADLHKEND